MLRRMMGAAVLAIALAGGAALAAEPVRIGFSIAQTGLFAAAAPSQLNAYELWKEEVNAAGGLDVYIETSSRALYQPTQSFYAKAGYRLAAEFPDFYAAGDGKLVFVKRLEPR